MKKLDTKIINFLALSDIVSLLNLSSGFLSIISSINNNLSLSAILMIIAIIFDSSDGWIARKINRNDEYGFGKNIDSLSDIVSFGIAPAIFLYIVSLPANINQTVTTPICLLIVVCGVLRLTRYNVLSDKLESTDFIGFPIPGISFILSTFYLSGTFNINLALILSIIVSLLMISNIRYKKIDNMHLIVISAGLIVLLLFPINLTLSHINIPAILLLLLGLCYLIINLIKK